MSATTEAVPLASSSTNATQLDALIIGAGIAGMYQLYRLRERGLTVRGWKLGTTSAAPVIGTAIPARASIRNRTSTSIGSPGS